KMAAPMSKILKKLLQQKLTFSRLVYLRKYNSIQIKDILDNETLLGKAIDVSGWVKFKRTHKAVSFFHINDGSCLTNLQIVLEGSSKSDAPFASCVKVRGVVTESDHPGQRLEIKAENIEVIGQNDPVQFPFKKKQPRPPLSNTRDHIHLRPKTDAFASLLRIRNQANCIINQYFQDSGYCHIHTPILSSNDCEGAGELFTVEGKDDSINKKKTNGKDVAKTEFFGAPTYLTVSGQLHLEVVTGAISKAYCFGPTFRAENSKTRHHLSEFYMIEAEVAFTSCLEDIMVIMEDLYKKTSVSLLESCTEDISGYYYKHFSQPDHYETNIKPALENTFIRMPYCEAIDILHDKRDNFDVQIKWGDDLHKVHEKFLVKHCGNIPVFLIHFPKQLKPFYMRQNDDGQTVACVDLLVPEVGELCGGSLREERYDVLETELKQIDKLKSLNWYLELRKFGCPPHAGFGMGFERYLQNILGLQNIRDVIPFPRWAHNCKL
ncbi:unnamed protein product, partial [Owenia fusiformis]